MQKDVTTPKISQDSGPTTEKQRFVVLDALRGLALMGIVLANFPEFGLWTFLGADEQAAMPTAKADGVVRFLQYMFVDGKFYTIFSVLFGIGFALFLARHSRKLFVRRMLILVLIGFLHMMFLWSGDILLLYAIGGLLLTLFVRLSDKALFWLAAALILVPVGLDALTEFCGVAFAQPFYDEWWRQAEARGINEENFATWLRDAESYPQMFAFLVQGAFERVWEFVEGHRLPKVLGLFILGYIVGKHRLFVKLNKLPLKAILCYALIPSLLLSAFYAWSATHHHPWGLTIHSLLYAFSVVPLACCYIVAFCLLFVRRPSGHVFQWLAAPGRMALTNYIGQSVIGIILFYGIGFGLGTSFGLVHICLTALTVFALQIIVSHYWLRAFRFGPLEWLWRMLTYGRHFPIRKSNS